MRVARGTTRAAAVAIALVLATAAGCSSDDGDDAAADDAGGATDQDQADASADDASADDADAADTAGSGGDSVLVVAGEAIEVDRTMCHLEPQESAGGGGMILATAQATGTNAEGENVHIDFTRFDEDSMFHGDDISLDVGELGESDHYREVLDEGAVDIDGDVVSISEVTLEDYESGTSFTVSFELAC